MSKWEASGQDAARAVRSLALAGKTVHAIVALVALGVSAGCGGAQPAPEAGPQARLQGYPPPPAEAVEQESLPILPAYAPPERGSEEGARPIDPAEVSKLRVENFSGLTEMEAYIYEHASQPLLDLLLQGEYSVFTYSTQFNPVPETGSNFCFALAGLTRPEPQDRNPRIPGQRFFGFHRSQKIGPLSEQDGNGCKVAAMQGALSGFFEESVSELLSFAGRTERTGPRAAKTRGRDLATYSSTTSSGFDAGDYLAGPIPNSFRAAFDHRYIEVVGLSANTDFGDNLVCFGLAGFSAVPPDGLMPRWPGSPVMNVREVPRAQARGPGDVDRCEGELMQSSVEAQLARTWDAQGLLLNFAATREDDIPLVRGPNQ